VVFVALDAKDKPREDKTKGKAEAENKLKSSFKQTWLQESVTPRGHF
jgi:hypothetical protein